MKVEFRIAGGKDPHPHDFSFTETWPVLPSANVVPTTAPKCPYEGQCCGKIDTERSLVENPAGVLSKVLRQHLVLGLGPSPSSDVGEAETVFLVNRVFLPCQKGAVLMKTAKMTNLHSTH